MSQNEINEQLVRAEVALQSELKGCTDQEVEGIEREYGPLPKSYVAFLKAIGHGAGRFLAGTDAFYKNLPSLKPDANNLLIEQGLAPLSHDAFVFYMHQGYEFGYFLLAAGDDPKVMQYVEGEKEPRVGWLSFTDYLNDLISQHKKPTTRL